MKLMKRTGVAALVLVLVLLVFTGVRSAKSAEASGPYNATYHQVCIQTGIVSIWQWQFDGYTWRWMSISRPVCLRWATVAVYQPVYPPYPTYPIYYSPVSACGYNGCIYRAPYYPTTYPW